MSQFFKSGGQSIWVSASASVLPMNVQDWFLLVWTGWISFDFKNSKFTCWQMAAPNPVTFQELKEVDIGFSMVVDNINNGIKIMLIIF